MTKYNEDKLLAELYLDLKGPKKKRDNWINIAKKCQLLIDNSPSVNKAAKKLGVSYELLRSIAILLTLPDEVKKKIKQGLILYDAAQRLNRIEESKKQIEVARSIAGLPSHKQREIIQFASKYPNTGIDNYKKRVTSLKSKTEKIHFTLVPLREDTFQKLDRYCKKNKSSIEKMILTMVEKWSKGK